MRVLFSLTHTDCLPDHLISINTPVADAQSRDRETTTVRHFSDLNIVHYSFFVYLKYLFFVICKDVYSVFENQLHQKNISSEVWLGKSSRSDTLLAEFGLTN
jgi:hypothetical protein